MHKNKPITSEPIHIHTDGACKGNPGGLGGWGAVLTNYEWIHEIYGGEADTTNNRMELMAVIKALEYLTESANVVVYTDSTYVQKGISEWIHGWKRNGWRTAAKQPVKNADLWKALDRAAHIHNVEWKWVKGHNGDLANERADVLANKGVELVRP